MDSVSGITCRYEGSLLGVIPITEYLHLRYPEPQIYDPFHPMNAARSRALLLLFATDSSTDQEIDTVWLKRRWPFLFSQVLTAADLWAAPRSMNTEYKDLVARYIEAHRNPPMSEFAT